MLSSLPPELLREIIESAVPHSFHSTTYRTRQKTLCSLSLVSKQFRAIAQPLLLEVVRIDPKRNLNRFIAGQQGGGGGGEEQERAINVKQAVLSCGWLEPTPEEYPNLKQMLSSVTALSMYHIPEAILSCTELESFSSSKIILSDPGLQVGIFTSDFSATGLTSLTLSNIDWKNPRTFTLPHLQSLTLHSLDYTFVSSFLDLVALPSLRHFAFDFDFSVDMLQHSAFNRLLPDLETLCSFEHHWTDSDSGFLHAYVEKTLIISDLETFSDSWSQTSDFPFAHLLFTNTDISVAEAADHISYYLDEFASSIKKGGRPALRSIFLDPWLLDPDSLPRCLRQSVKYLARVCRQKGIEVVVEPGRRDFSSDPWISPSFVERQKKLRMEEKKAK
ncbi:uncharacterized protein JCM6883_002152 [Sporobolomyces salmoneus]|uniref:uncharacterized protein n=1 Tax=Sporobolomyces salmoneus TaxID=183962 RepID=UPI003178F0C8